MTATKQRPGTKHGAEAAGSSRPAPPRMPYSAVVGQKQVKLALELCFVEPRIGGVLLSGERGTGKTTAVRAFARMALDKALVNLPINATEDRVVGGWDIEALFLREPKPDFKPGLLEEAHEGLLYVDEVNLLDDHIVNIILDVTSSGFLAVQRDMWNHEADVQFVLVGTMNPEEGTLRPQLLDRFGLMVAVKAEPGDAERVAILEQVLNMEDPALQRKKLKADQRHRARLHAAREALANVKLPTERSKDCVDVARALDVEGHRGELVMARAARALAAIERRDVVSVEDVREVAPLALAHRRRPGAQREVAPWGTEDDALVDKALGRAAPAD